MIRQKEFYQSPGRIIRALLAGIAAIALAKAAQAAPPDTGQALDLITNTADRICNVVTTKGEVESTQVTGQVKAELSGLASRLANVGISGTGSITNEQYQNVLRQDLASTLHDNAQCKLKVFEDLQVKLIPEAPTERTIPPNVERPIQWGDNFSFWSSQDAVLGFSVWGPNVNPIPVQLNDAYIISDMTGERITLQVALRPGDVSTLKPISDINAIPTKAILSLWATFRLPGLSPSEFLEHWGGFRLHVEYSGIKPDDKVYSRELVQGIAQGQFPQLGPHVTPKTPSSAR
jgi:hypothetical protein